MQLNDLILNLDQTNIFFIQQVNKQVNVALTLRNWFFGFYLAEYEQLGADRAAYGTRLYRTLAQKLQAKNIKGFSYTNLHLYKQFYQTYPQIVQTESVVT